MTLIDTHCHLYANEFAADMDTVIKNAINNSIDKFYLPAIDSSTHDKMIALEKLYPNNCAAMIGLHPCYVKENFIEELDVVQDWLHKKKFVAIGEIGLDFYWDKTFANNQLLAFKKQIQLSLQYNLPIVIHTRNAMPQTIDVVKQYVLQGVTGIFHCFSGTLQDAKAIINMGFYLGIGGVATYKNSGLTTILENIDLKHLVLETDAPYLAPVPFRGKRNESSYLKFIAQKLAQIKNVSIEEVATVTTANAQKIFGL